MTHIRQRRDTAANWVATNPILQLGEVGWESDTRKAKLGDGSTAWNALLYAVAPVDVTAIEDQIDDLYDIVEDLENTIPEWVPGTYPANRVVEYQNRFWRATVETDDTPALPVDTPPIVGTVLESVAVGAQVSFVAPPGIMAGDLLVFIGGGGTTATSRDLITVPAGWSAPVTLGTGFATSGASTKTATGSESGTSLVFEWSGTLANVRGYLYVIRGAASVKTPVVSAANLGSRTLALPTVESYSVSVSMAATSSSTAMTISDATAVLVAGSPSSTAGPHGGAWRLAGPRAAAGLTFTAGAPLGAGAVVAVGYPGVASEWELIQTTGDLSAALANSRLDAMEPKVQAATETSTGTTRLATSAEAAATTTPLNTVAVTPAGLLNVRNSDIASAQKHYRPTRVPIGAYQPPAYVVGGTGGGNLRTGEFCAIPIDVGFTAGFSGLGYRLTQGIAGGGATCVFSMALYNDAGDNIAPNLTSRVATCVTDPATTPVSGAIDCAFSGGAVALTAGRYWIGMLAVITGTPVTPPQASLIYPVLPVTTNGLFWLANGIGARYLRATGLAALPTTNIALTYEALDAPYSVGMKRSS